MFFVQTPVGVTRRVPACPQIISCGFWPKMETPRWQSALWYSLSYPDSTRCHSSDTQRCQGQDIFWGEAGFPRTPSGVRGACPHFWGPVLDQNWGDVAEAIRFFEDNRPSVPRPPAGDTTPAWQRASHRVGGAPGPPQESRGASSRGTPTTHRGT